MQVSATKLPGCVVITPTVHGDHRGFFYESFQQQRYQQLAGIHCSFVQDNHSRSSYGVLRGLHFQRNRPQGKLVRVVQGEIFDVVVDLRLDSPTFGLWHAERLSADNKKQLWLPPGFAHGFLVTSAVAEVEYKCTDYYDASDEGSIHFADPDLAIAWPNLDSPYLLSEKDQGAGSFAQFKRSQSSGVVRVTQ